MHSRLQLGRGGLPSCCCCWRRQLLLLLPLLWLQQLPCCLPSGSASSSALLHLLRLSCLSQQAVDSLLLPLLVICCCGVWGQGSHEAALVCCDVYGHHHLLPAVHVHCLQAAGLNSQHVQVPERLQGQTARSSSSSSRNIDTVKDGKLALWQCLAESQCHEWLGQQCTVDTYLACMNLP